MFCVNESLKTAVSTVSGLGGGRGWAGASHPFGEVMTGTTTLKAWGNQQKAFKDGMLKIFLGDRRNPVQPATGGGALVSVSGFDRRGA